MVAAMRWFGLALLGILIAAAVSVAASRLASQQIGLASEPISAGDALAPAVKQKPKPQRAKQPGGGERTTTSPAPTIPAPLPETTEPPSSETPSTPAAPEINSGGRDGEEGSGGADD